MATSPAQLFVMPRDRAMRGAVHPALEWSLAALLANYAVIDLLSRVPAFAAWAESLDPGI